MKSKSIYTLAIEEDVNLQEIEDKIFIDLFESNKLYDLHIIFFSNEELYKKFCQEHYQRGAYFLKKSTIKDLHNNYLYKNIKQIILLERKFTIIKSFNNIEDKISIFQ